MPKRLWRRDLLVVEYMISKAFFNEEYSPAAMRYRKHVEMIRNICSLVEQPPLRACQFSLPVSRLIQLPVDEISHSNAGKETANDGQWERSRWQTEANSTNEHNGLKSLSKDRDEG